MTYKIIYIDDEPNKNVINPYVNDFTKTGDLEVEVKNPTDFKNQIQEFEKNDFCALILDYKLSEYANPNEEDKTNIYDAPALAQELRTKAIEKDSVIVETPIILFSSIDYLEKYYKKDLVSHDLFDMIFKKNDLYKIRTEVISKILSVIMSYERIGKNPELNNILGEGIEQYLDPRFLEYLEIQRATGAVYSISTFIFRKLILTNGALIDKETLAARLGIDIEKSTDWIRLVSLLENYKYKGIFYDAYERWWWRGIEKWWKSDNSPNLKGSSAEKRIDFLKEKTKLDLNPADKLELARGDSFWTICEHYRKPLDPIDGFKIRGSSLYPWMEYSYYSLKALLEFPELIDQLQESERTRFNQIKREFV